MNEIRVLLLNGSPRANGNTALALREMEKVFAQNGVQTETVLLGNQAIRGCTACGACAKLGRCVFDDAVNELAPKLEASSVSTWKDRSWRLQMAAPSTLETTT